ncbi:MAG: 3-oxoacyl-[acyl-carrier-protein] reductase [Alphaproteobacteria bacterium RIFCSPLOWO2_01_FULL_45_8]|nr:MAG: 3-oxoacyl-[acyl-carrier-protein] reductase [Alphaproteobacteria bacterium GWB1_45_5]OFW75843.1 MAG: 3-oxoacyl-[acyl-carrier-protein] reductase [Alphaproteobacteria bacterium GWA1_45_9]OFW89931.1 MAG: 3-oxoacyl-[acyl-carrier-protein] reductase [Alphaproteobacteria bacterium RIFCSPHIGHO2_01_FULL_41_14]OFW96626.1 MAG: 3-oxoacyl-[acyl-carrier-protein] reductase [Alphaproteobacteria bacterium RIFCSPLOWO2_01_FULL_45_8]HCI48371.1 3-oxoacyl-[acyl-carrier-protein] reductase [Holosporales bacteri
MFDFKERKILVTGASGAIGQAIASSFHARGATVTLSGRRQDALEKIADGLRNERVHIVTCDLGDEASVSKLIPDTMEKMGAIDTLINNAGITKDGLMFVMKPEAWQEVLRVDLEVPFRLTQAVLRSMLKAQFGRIINITSVVGVTGNPGQTNYSAAKAGLIGMSKSLAKEVASRNITVNCIAPGFIKSPMTDILTEEQKEKIAFSIPQGHIGAPEDIAAAAVYLASREAGYVTGQTIHVNGGMAMV